MDPAGFDLARLLRPVGPAAFFRDTWEKEPLVLARGEPGYYRGLFGLADVDALIAYTRPKFAEPGGLGPGAGRPDTFVKGWLAEESLRAETFPGIAELRQAYRAGKTLIITALQHRWPPLAAFCRHLEGVFGCAVHANLYLTPKGAQGFSAHFDTHEVFVLQVEGSKHWRLYGEARARPLAEENGVLPAPPGPPTREFRLGAGDLLYLPRGHVHDAFTSECASLHLTVGVRVFRWADLLRRALDEAAAREVRFRESLPAGLLAGEVPPESARQQFGELLQLLAQSARVEEAVSRLAGEFFGGLPALPGGHFLPREEEIEAIALDTVLERAPGAITRVEEGGGRAAVVFPGNRVEAPARIAAALSFVARTPRFAARHLPDVLSPESKLVLVRRLVREGLLVVAAAQPATPPCR
jgi:hypothetical protein